MDGAGTRSLPCPTPALPGLSLPPCARPLPGQLGEWSLGHRPCLPGSCEGPQAASETQGRKQQQLGSDGASWRACGQERRGQRGLGAREPAGVGSQGRLARPAQKAGRPGGSHPATTLPHAPPGRPLPGHQAKKERCRVSQRDLAGRELAYSVQARCHPLSPGPGDLGLKASSLSQAQLGCLIRYARAPSGLPPGQNVPHLPYRAFCGCLSPRRPTTRPPHNSANRFGRGPGAPRRPADPGGRFPGGRRTEARCQAPLGVHTGRRGCPQALVPERATPLGSELPKAVCTEGKRARTPSWRLRPSVGSWLQGAPGPGLCARGQPSRCL